MRLLRTSLLILLCLLTMQAASAAASAPLAVILLPGTSLSDWRSAHAPTLQRIMATGAIAVMNTRTARRASDHARETPESAALTLGAGSRAAGGSEVTDFHPAPQIVPGLACTYGELYTRRTGMTWRPQNWVNADWATSQRENAGKGYDLAPGNLGSALQRHAISVICGGGRLANAIACNADGVIPTVSAGSSLPHSLPQCLIWDAGPNLATADKVISDVAAEVQKQHGTLLIISPFVSDRDYATGRRLSPVVLWGQRIASGLLYSPSTHRAGLVTNTDFAPTVVTLLGASPDSRWLASEPFGHAWKTRASHGNIAQVVRLESAAYRQARGMAVLPAIAIVLGLLLIGQLVLARRRSIYSISWLPLVIIWALVISPDIGWAFVVIAILGIVLWRLAIRFSPWHSICAVAALIAATLVVDLLVGNPLMRWGMLGYSAVEGARYYGIGNESMGPLIGALMVSAAFLWSKRIELRVGIAIAFIVCAALLGLPAAGAKAGGVLVAVAAFSVFLWTIWGKRLTPAAIGAIIVLMVCALAWIASGDVGHRTAQQSHIGRGVERVESGGIREAAEIADRKLAVEGRLLYHSAWAFPLWTSFAGLIILSKHRLTGEKRALLRGGVAGIIACLAVNDAGVVAGALCGVLITSALSAPDAPSLGPRAESSMLPLRRGH